MLSLPTNSWGDDTNLLQSSPTSERQSSSYYLQNDQQYDNPQKHNVVSIQTQRSNANEYKLIRRQSDKRGASKKKQTVKRVSLGVILATFAASSFRASLRKARVVRSATPWGRMRNISALGNGVSIVRVCMALGFDADNNIDEGSDAGSLLNKLRLEDEELYINSAILTQQQLGGNDAYGLRQKALANFLSNVASTMVPYSTAMRYGSIDSVRLPFVEEAVQEFKRAANEERGAYDGRRLKKKQGQEQKRSTSAKRYVLATILLAIKGDHTANIPLPLFGIIRQRDMARILARIATDAKVDDCLVGAEVQILPDKASGGLTEKEILQLFPDLVPLT